MGYTLFTVSVYVLMRAFEVVFADKKNKGWYKNSIKVIGSLAIYAALAALLSFYFSGIQLLGFKPN
jgi:hypothetical protein